MSTWNNHLVESGGGVFEHAIKLVFNSTLIELKPYAGLVILPLLLIHTNVHIGSITIFHLFIYLLSYLPVLTVFYLFVLLFTWFFSLSLLPDVSVWQFRSWWSILIFVATQLLYSFTILCSFILPNYFCTVFFFLCNLYFWQNEMVGY